MEEKYKDTRDELQQKQASLDCLEGTSDVIKNLEEQVLRYEEEISSLKSELKGKEDAH